MTTDADELARLISEADARLESNDFSVALDLYRKAATKDEPSKHVLVNLSVAQDQESIRFWRDLSRLFPNSIQVRLGEARALLAARFFGNAAEVCTELLRTEATAAERTAILRLRVACSSGGRRYELMMSDLAALWSSSDPLATAPRFRVGVLEELVRLADPDAIAALESFGNMPNVPDEVRALVTAKVHELEEFKKAAEFGTSFQ